MNPEKIFKSEEGAVLVVSLLMLVVLTIIGIAATNTSIMETQISNSHKKKQAAFYAAEAGVEHAKIVLSNSLGANPAPPNAGVGTVAPWEFVFNGDYDDVADDSPFKNPQAGREVFLFQNVTFGDHTYTVTLGDNKDDSDAENGTLWVRSTGIGPRGARAAVEVSYLGQFTDVEGGETISDYSAQDKFGAGKGSSGNDTEAIGAGDFLSNQLDQQI